MYTQIDSMRQQKLNNLKGAGKCFFTIVDGIWDVTGTFYPYLQNEQCKSCSTKEICAKLRQLVEEIMNL